jgi:putative salt-induced outer membrane protein
VLGSDEHDRFAGFDRRPSEAIGAGHDAYKTQTMSLAFEAGPAYRQAESIDGASEKRVGLRVATSYARTIGPDIPLTENAVYDAQSGDGTPGSTTAPTAKIRGARSVQASLVHNHEQHPPLGLDETDTTTRLTLVCGFET